MKSTVLGWWALLTAGPDSEQLSQGSFEFSNLRVFEKCGRLLLVHS